MFKNFHVFLIVITTVLLCFSPRTYAQPNVTNTSTVPVLVADNFNEVRDPVQLISGSGLKGIFYPTPSTSVSPAALFVELSNDVTFPLNVSITMFDGGYKASWSVNAAVSGAQWARMQYNSRESDLIEGLDKEHVAALVKDASGKVLPVSWGKPNKAAEVTIMINSERADAYLVARSGNSYKKIDCQPVSSNRTVRYDKICTFDPALLKLVNGQVEVRRKRGGSKLSPLLFSLSK